MDYLKTNRDTWDKRTAIHVKSEFYDIDGFLSGDCTLKEIELAELGDVSGKTLLHLQCHFGLDTLSWARRGARVTGVDLSPQAIAKANELASTTGLDAQFICSDVYQVWEHTAEQYDIVFTSYGVVCWLPDIDRWARVIARSLKPGGTFHIAEFHPVYDLVAGFRYFHSPEPDVEQEGTYTENCDGEESSIVLWAHPVSDVINALIRAGIRIDQFNEHPYSPHNCFEGLEEREPGRFYLDNNGHDVPLVYSILGKKL